MNLAQIRTGVIAGVSRIGGRMFQRNALKEQTGDYIVFRRAIPKTRDMVRETNILQFFCFSKSLEDLELLSNELIAYFEDRHQVGTDHYFKIYFISQVDSTDKLENGFYFNILTFGFRKTT